MQTTLVIGCGNPLRGDDGVGVEVARRLAAHPLPAHVRCVDAGTAGLDIVLMLRGVSRAVLIDAAMPTAGSPHTPGRLHAGSPADLSDQQAWATSGVSIHTVRWDQALALAQALGGPHPAEIRCYLIEAASFDHGSPLSPAVEATAVSLVAQLREDLCG